MFALCTFNDKRQYCSSRVKANTFRLKSDVNDIKSPVVESHASKLESAVKTNGCGRPRVGTTFASTSEGFENKNVEVNPQFCVTEPKLKLNNATDTLNQRRIQDFAHCNDAMPS